MKVVPIAAYLSEFDSEIPTDGSLVDLQSANSQSLPIEQKGPSPDDLEEKFDAGLLEGKKQAQAELSSRLKEQEVLLTNQFNQEIAKLQGDLAEQLAGQLKAELNSVETTIANSLAAVIKPFVSGVVEIRILDELTTAINDILNDSQSCQITVRGPKGLLDALESNLNNTTASIVFVESGGPEICVEHGRERIESRLNAWSNLIKSELG